MKPLSILGLTGLLSLGLTTAALSVTNNFTVTPSNPGPGAYDANNTVSVRGDFSPGYLDSSMASDGSGKTDIYFTPTALFGRTVTVTEIASISYWTKMGTTHAVDPRNWFLTIYTNPYAGDLSSPTWYGDRYGSEPYLSNNLSDPVNTWNLFASDGTSNTLRFFESTEGAPGASLGTVADPDWATFKAQNGLSGQPRGTREILYLTLQTGSYWLNGFTGKVDGFTITLTDGTIARINFEADPLTLDSDGDGVLDHLDECPFSDRRALVDVNGRQAGRTSIRNNSVDEDGCTIQDRVNHAIRGARNHGQYVRQIASLANELKREGAINQRQRQQMVVGAAQSNIGKKRR